MGCAMFLSQVGSVLCLQALCATALMSLLRAWVTPALALRARRPDRRCCPGRPFSVPCLPQLLYILGIELSGVTVATCMQPAIPVRWLAGAAGRLGRLAGWDGPLNVRAPRGCAALLAWRAAAAALCCGPLASGTPHLSADAPRCAGVHGADRDRAGHGARQPTQADRWAQLPGAVVPAGSVQHAHDPSTLSTSLPLRAAWSPARSSACRQPASAARCVWRLTQPDPPACPCRRRSLPLCSRRHRLGGGGRSLHGGGRRGVCQPRPRRHRQPGGAHAGRGPVPAGQHAGHGDLLHYFQADGGEIPRHLRGSVGVPRGCVAFTVLSSQLAVARRQCTAAACSANGSACKHRPHRARLPPRLPCQPVTRAG